MVNKLIITVVAMLVVVGFATADEFDAVINDASRAFTRQKKSPEKFIYGKLTLDSKGKVVSTIYKEGMVTKDTKVVMGTFDEKMKKWVPGELIEGGLGADLFKEAAKVVQVRVTVGDDKNTISRILVKKTDEPLVMADSEFDAVLKQVGPQTNGAGGIWYTRIELDEKGGVLKTFALTSGRVTKDTKVVMGKYNDKEIKWDAGDDIPKGLYGDIFKDLGAQDGLCTDYVPGRPQSDLANPRAPNRRAGQEVGFGQRSRAEPSTSAEPASIAGSRDFVAVPGGPGS